MANPYLDRLRTEYDGIKTTINDLQTRAADESRDLTDTEMTSIRQQGDRAKNLATQIEELAELETRNAKVASLAAEVVPAAETKARSATTAVDRDPGHYRKDGGFSFFGDVYKSRSLQDSTATRRLVEHNRAVNMADEGPGVVAPQWMVSEFADIARQGRRVSAAVRNIRIDSANPLILPYQAAASGTVADLTSDEGTTSFTDGFDTAYNTVTPKIVAGGQNVTRALLDSGNPAVDLLVFGDLLGAYDQNVEAKVVAAMVTAAGAATKTYATEAAWTTGLDPEHATYVGDAILDTAIAVRSGRKLPADILVCSVNRYGSLLKIKDTTGRPMIPGDSGGLVNVVGSGTVAVDGRVHGLGVIASDGVTQYPESLLVARASDTLLFESSVLRFSYDQVAGPEVVRMGIYAYVAAAVKYASSVERIAITAAS